MSTTEPQIEQMSYLPHWQARRGLFFPILFFFVCLFIFFKINGPLVISSNQNNTFSVDGTGEAKGIPTKATFSLTVTAKDADEKRATDGLNTRVKQITDDLKKLGIKEADIKTANLQSYPTFTPSETPPPERLNSINPSAANQPAIALPQISTIPGGTTVNQWTASETVDVQAATVDLARNALAAAQTDGADPAVDGVQFTLDQAAQTNLEQRARIAAIKDAKIKAEEIAKESGIHLGRVINVTENGNGVYQPNTMMKSDAAGSTPVAPQFNPGQNTVTKTVTLYYETR